MTVFFYKYAAISSRQTMPIGHPVSSVWDLPGVSLKIVEILGRIESIVENPQPVIQLKSIFSQLSTSGAEIGLRSLPNDNPDFKPIYDCLKALVKSAPPQFLTIQRLFHVTLAKLSTLPYKSGHHPADKMAAFLESHPDVSDGIRSNMQRIDFALASVAVTSFSATKLATYSEESMSRERLLSQSRSVGSNGAMTEFRVASGRVAEPLDKGRFMEEIRQASFVSESSHTNESVLTIAYLLMGDNPVGVEDLTRFTEEFCGASALFVQQTLSQLQDKHGILPEFAAELEAFLVPHTGTFLDSFLADKTGPIRLLQESIPTFMNMLFYTALFGLPTPTSVVVGLSSALALRHAQPGLERAISAPAEQLGMEPESSHYYAGQAVGTINKAAKLFSLGGSPGQVALTLATSWGVNKAADAVGTTKRVSGNEKNRPAVAQLKSPKMETTTSSYRALFMMLVCLLQIVIFPMIMDMFSEGRKA